MESGEISTHRMAIPSRIGQTSRPLDQLQHRQEALKQKAETHYSSIILVHAWLESCQDHTAKMADKSALTSPEPDLSHLLCL